MEATHQTASKPKVIILDVYETLLDMTDVERRVNNFLDTGKGYIIWFELFMEYCFVDNCLAQFNDFASIAKATMQMTARKLGRTIQERDTEVVLELLKHLPVHEGVQEGLSELNDKGYRIAALTNSPEKVVCERMERTGLISYFEKVFSAEQIKTYKPAIAVYDWAAKNLGIQKEDAMLISSHSWDIAGAAKAGMQTAYLKKGRDSLYSLAPQPILICKNLPDLAGQLNELFKEENK